MGKAKTTMDPRELRRNLLFYHYFKNHRSFQAFWGKHIRSEYQHRYYLLPLMANPKIGTNADAVVYGGRVTGKSWSMELSMAHAMFNSPSGLLGKHREREVILTGSRDVHISQRCEPLFDFFNARVPLWKEMVTVSRRKPYELRLKNGSIFWGLSVGNDPTAKNLEGPHPWRRYIEETAHFPQEAWKKFQDTAHEGGTVDTFIGVCDGRIDTPYYKIDHDHYDRYVGVQFHIPQIFNPSWTQDRKQQRVYDLKGVNSDAYIQQVLAQWGTPAEGIWDLSDLRACLVENLPYTEKIWTPDDTRKGVKIGQVRARIAELIEELPEVAKTHSDYVVAFDPGYTQDGEICTFGRVKDSPNQENPEGVWDLFVRVIVRNRVVFQDSAHIFHLICLRYSAATEGIDATGEQGKDIANLISDREDPIYRPHNYTKTLYLYEGQKNIITGHRIERDDHGRDAEQELKQGLKDFTTNQLSSWFTRKSFRIPLEATDFIPAFNSEALKITVVGNKIIETPKDIHLPDVFRVFYATWHNRSGRIDAPRTSFPIALPIIGKDPNPVRL